MRKDEAIKILICSVVEDLELEINDLEEMKAFVISIELMASIELCFIGRFKARIGVLREIHKMLNFALPFMNQDDKEYMLKFKRRLKEWRIIKE